MNMCVCVRVHVHVRTRVCMCVYIEGQWKQTATSCKLSELQCISTITLSIIIFIKKFLLHYYLKHLGFTHVRFLGFYFDLVFHQANTKLTVFYFYMHLINGQINFKHIKFDSKKTKEIEIMIVREFLKKIRESLLFHH